MKKIATLFCLLTLCSAVQAQTINLTELVLQRYCHDAECFAKFITGKGFYFDKIGNEISTTESYYKSKEVFPSNNKNVSKSNEARFDLRRGSRTIIYSTVSEEQYKRQIEGQYLQNGFQVKNTSTDPDHWSLKFNSTIYPKILLMVRMDTFKEDGNSYKSYNVVLSFFD